MTITDYSPGPPAKVTIDNQWGKGADHDATKPLSVHDLYQAIKDKDHAISELEKDVKKAKDAGHPDTYKELDLARLKFNDGKITKEDYEKEITRLSKEVAKLPDGDEKKHSLEKLRDSMNSLEPAAALRVLKEQKNDGMLSESEYKEAIKHQVDVMLSIRTVTKQMGQWQKLGKPLFDQGVAELMDSIKDFTAEEVKAIRDQIKAGK